MQRLRNATLLARLVLACFALAIGAAVASPLVKPATAQLLCSSDGSIQLQADGGDQSSAHALDCPLCVATAPPPAWFALALTSEQPDHIARVGLSQRNVALMAGAPLPPRGPPLQVGG
jgi:hypothetical protein